MLKYKDDKPLQVRAVPSDLRGRSVKLVMFTQTQDVQMSFVEAAPGAEPEPFFISQQVAQELADDLYRCGVRPSEAAGSAGAMAAVQEHLKDLRKLLFEDPRTRGVQAGMVPPLEG